MDGTKLQGRTIKVQNSNSLNNNNKTPKKFNNNQSQGFNQGYNQNNSWNNNKDFSGSQKVNTEGRFKYYKNSTQEDTARRTGAIVKSDGKKVMILD